jgi:hypothetical protein
MIQCQLVAEMRSFGQPMMDDFISRVGIEVNWRRVEWL